MNPTRNGYEQPALRPGTLLLSDYYGLRIINEHRHDSRPGSWCVLIGPLNERSRVRYHVGYDPHGFGNLTVSNARSWDKVESAADWPTALAIIASWWRS